MSKLNCIFILQYAILGWFIQSGLKAHQIAEDQINVFNPIQKFPISNIGLDFFNNISRTTKAELSSECLIQLDLLNYGLTNKYKYAWEFIDSWGTIPSGIVYKNHLELGNFDECMRINVHVNKEVMKGKYCLSSWPMYKLQNITQVRIGICFPDLCKADEIEMILREYLNSIFSWNIDKQFDMIAESNCQVQGKESLNTLDWVAVGIFTILGLFVIFSSSYDFLTKYYGKQSRPLLISFSLQKNLRQVFNTTASNTDNPNVVQCLHGIRALTFLIILIIHCDLMAIIGQNINTIDIEVWMRNPLSMIFQGATFMVDTFFFLSGFLVIFGSFRTVEKNHGITNSIFLIVHRYLRLTPTMAFTLLYFVTFYRFMGSGPLWHNTIGMYHFCEENWWQTLLYIQNYLTANSMCLPHCWYLSVDFQLYFLTSLLLCILWKWKRTGLIAIVVVGVLLAVYLFVVVIIHDLNIFQTTQHTNLDSKEMPLIYYSLYSRTSPWIIGGLFGYVMHKRKGQYSVVSKPIFFLGWFTTIILIITALFSLYPTVHRADVLTPIEGAFYLTFSHIGWSLALCWIIFVCINRIGGPVNTFLCWSFWVPLSNLSYCMYLCHLPVMIANIARIRTINYFSDYDIMLSFWSYFAMVFFIGLLMYLSIEAPFANIEKLLLAKCRVNVKKVSEANLS